MPTAESAGAIGDSLREQALTMHYTKLACAGCSLDAWTSDPDAIAQLVDHALFDHIGRQSIMGVREDELITGYALALRRGAPPQTEHEQRWRDEQAVAS